MVRIKCCCGLIEASEGYCYELPKFGAWVRLLTHQLITSLALDELRSATHFAPLHIPQALSLIASRAVTLSFSGAIRLF